MDADRFDEIAKALGLSAARRGMVTGLLGGGVASLLANLGAAGRRRTRRNDDLSAEKRKKKKCKKCGSCRSCKKGKCKPKSDGTPCSGGSCKGGACQPGDNAPPCTLDDCPLPSQCSESILENCTAALQAQLLADAEPCRSDCEAGDSPACRACLEPLVTARMPEVQACIVASCGPSGAARGGAGSAAHSDPRAARVSWQRRCNRPCCPDEFGECVEEFNSEFTVCMVPALAGCFLGPGCVVPLLACMYWSSYHNTKCTEKYGCLDWGGCHADGTCCPSGETACGGGLCCPAGTTCCDGQKCCDTATHETCYPGLPGELPSCCEPGWQPCHGGCCFADNKCCQRGSGGGYCCHPNARCCDSASGCCV